jgi:hypothetical protein
MGICQGSSASVPEALRTPVMALHSACWQNTLLPMCQPSGAQALSDAASPAASRQRREGAGAVGMCMRMLRVGVLCEGEIRCTTGGDSRLQSRALLVRGGQRDPPHQPRHPRLR